VLSAVLLGATVWSLIILFRQKKAWEAYAKRKGLTFTKGKFSSSCEMEGSIDGFHVSFFSATQQKEDSRKNRQLTVMQLTLPKPFVNAIGAGTAEMLPFLNSLSEVTPHPIESDKWDKKTNHLFSKNKKSVETFLTPERITILNNILKMKNSDNLILMEEEQGVFRFETSNPMTDVGTIDRLVSKLIASIRKLVPSEEELKSLQALYSVDEKIEATDFVAPLSQEEKIISDVAGDEKVTLELEADNPED
jgi:hypothetical protein